MCVATCSCAWGRKKPACLVTGRWLRGLTWPGWVSGTGALTHPKLVCFVKVSPSAHLSPMLTEKAKGGVDPAEEVLSGERLQGAQVHAAYSQGCCARARGWSCTWGVGIALGGSGFALVLSTPESGLGNQRAGSAVKGEDE